MKVVIGLLFIGILGATVAAQPGGPAAAQPLTGANVAALLPGQADFERDVKAATEQYERAKLRFTEATERARLNYVKTLEDNIKEKGWEYDGKAYQERLKQAVQHAKYERFRDAFRAQCRAMLVLMEAVHRYRGRNEDFKPMW